MFFDSAIKRTKHIFVAISVTLIIYLCLFRAAPFQLFCTYIVCAYSTILLQYNRAYEFQFKYIRFMSVFVVHFRVDYIFGLCFCFVYKTIERNKKKCKRRRKKCAIYCFFIYTSNIVQFGFFHFKT